MLECFLGNHHLFPATSAVIAYSSLTSSSVTFFTYNISRVKVLQDYFKVKPVK